MRLVAIAVTLGILPSHPVVHHPAAPVSEHVRSAVRVLPLHFEENRGQAPGAVKYLARAAGYDAFLTGGGARIALRTPGTPTKSGAFIVMDRLGDAAGRPRCAGPAERVDDSEALT